MKKNVFLISEICCGYLTYQGAPALKRPLSRTYFVVLWVGGGGTLTHIKNDRCKNNDHQQTIKELLLL